ncbi:unnamed protein product [Sphagnum troendelagicum]|uniref:Uncharacterized protein n=1 Tax=Sphagnum troendelagicum TaxID=128251 RepID=A0ABP0V3P5_9BRYO
MARGCSYCGHNGHNSRTCPDRGVRLFGVRLTDGVMRKSMSMSNLSHYASANNPPSPPEQSGSGATPDGYVSDGLVQTSNNARERKKGVPWTEEEHRLFLLGLQKLGKGDWRGISRNFVQTRTPTQVASHAQKYFIRQSNLNKRKRRSSLFDIVSETVYAARPMLQQPVAALPSSGGLPPNGPLGISNIPYAFPMWPGPTGQAYGRPTNSPSMNSKLVRPTASVPTVPVKIDEAKEMSHLSLGLSPPEPSQLTLKLLDPPSRHSSAFQVNSSFNSSSISPSSNAISVV